MKKVMWPDDLEMPNDEFFVHKTVDLLLNNAATKCKIDWDQLKGDTIKEKFDTFYTKLVEATNMIISKGGKGFFWIVCSPILASVFENKDYVSDAVSQLPLGYNVVTFMGVSYKRWRIYADPLIKPNTILIGAGFSRKQAEYYCDIEVENFLK